ncbi:hypothetical protein CN335_12530 [Bacillus thuringiensis]|uniref:tetratricopeptide repeat protein n=1 Tax=Bacillus thuringiensis TaxID=1428 RepID=UPI000BF362DA|nr:tetratricopeptide repeat protein [Bacillus thuringiensis]PFF39000.1 hypothetical protein CN335_12530 [Bacillus thuringiensis]PFT16208.1 hypothetical protein COK83_11510 [Bacillus thuringiensis]HEB2439600.1 tetratricopeptide repeat protein [Bacillus thuringiensis]
MNDRENIQAKMCTLIENYIEALNPTVTTEIKTVIITDRDADNVIKIPEICIEWGITDDLFLWEKEELNKLNNKLNNKLDDEILTDSKIKSVEDFTEIAFSNYDNEENTSFANVEELRYLNFLEIEKCEHLLFHLTFTGFEDDIRDISVNNHHFSFLKYVMDCLFNNCKMEDMELALNKMLEQNIDDFISSIGRDFINNLINRVCNEEGNEKYNLHDEFNFISTLNYEGHSINAKLLLVDENVIDENINFAIKFNEQISFKEHRKIRKLLEMTDDNIYLIGDNKHIYGLGNLRNLHGLQEGYTSRALLIDFIGRFEYKIKSIKIIHNITVGETGKYEIVNWFYEEKNLLSVKYRKMELIENTLSETKLKDALQKTFNSYFLKEGNANGEIERDKKITDIIDIVKCAYNQKHGTTLVITTPDIAKEEVQRLKKQSIKINLIDIKRSNYFKKIVEKITTIDGALYMDITGQFHAIGVILDGYAEAEEGDSSRGARYNSAIRYKNGKSVNGNCIIIVISEDGMIDILPDNIQEEKKINELANQIKSLYKDKNFEKALNLVRELEALNPRRPETFLAKARILIGMDKAPEEPIEALNYAIKLKEDFAVAYNLRGLLYKKLQKPKEAIYDFEKALKIKPNSIVYANLGNTLVVLDQFQEAIFSYSKAIELNERYLNAYFGRAKTFVKVNDFEKALDDVNTLIKLKGNEPDLIRIQADLYKLLDDFEKAIVMYKKSIDLYEKSLNGDNNKIVYENLVDICKEILVCVTDEDAEEKYQQLYEKYKEELTKLKNKE